MISPSSHRAGAPASASTPSTVKTKTIAVPRSGCSMTSPSGTAARASTSGTSLPRDARSWVRRSASSTAIPATSATFANSLGCTWKPPPTTIHECAPLIVVPTTRTETRPMQDAT